MKLYLKFNINTLSKKILEDNFKALNLKYSVLGFGEIELLEKINPEQYLNLNTALNTYGIEVIENQKVVLVQKIKHAIRDLVFNEDTPITIKSSVYLAEKLGHSYSYLSNIFSQVTHSSIENYMIIQKIEYTKQLILNTELNLTEIAFKLNYSSVAHLSTQFKGITGLTPSAFQRIILKRRNIALQKTNALDS